MFRIIEDISSAGSLVQCLAKNYNNDSIVSVDMDKFCVMSAYSDPLCVCALHCALIYSELHTHTQRLRICCYNTDLVHVNGHDRTILVIFSQTLYKAP